MSDLSNTGNHDLTALSETDRARWLAVFSDVLAETADETKAALAAWGAVHKARVMGMAGKSTNDNPRIGGWGMLFTDPGDKDLDNQFFDADSVPPIELAGRSLWYEHGMDKAYGSDLIGERVAEKVYKRGIWTEHELYPDHPQYDRTMREIEDGALCLSSDSVAHHVRNGYDPESGYLGVWPIAGWSLTKTPAEPGLGPVTFSEFAEAVKASAQAREAQSARTTAAQKDKGMNEELLKGLAGFLSVDETPEAVKTSMEELIAQMQGMEDAPPDEEKADGPDLNALRQALGLAPDAPPAEIAARMQAMMEMLMAEPAAASAGKSFNYDQLTAAAELAAKNAPALPSRVPKLHQGNGMPGEKSTKFNVNYNRGAKVPGLAELVMGVIEKKSDSAMKAMGYSAGPTGGYFLRQEIANEMIELFRAQAVTMQLGATYVPMAGIETLTYRKQLTGATATYRGEAQTATPTDLTFGIVNLQLKELISAVRINRRLLKNSVENLDALIRSDLQIAVNLRADKAHLRGTGGIPNETGATGAEPRGVLYTTNVTSTNLATNGAVPTVDDFIDAWGRIEDADVPVSGTWGIAMSPRTKRVMENQRDTTGQLLTDERWSQGHKYLTTTQIPNTLTVGSSSDCSEVYLAAWEYLIVGMGQDVEIIVDESVYRTSGEIYIEATMMHDCAVAQPVAFEILTGVRA